MRPPLPRELNGYQPYQNAVAVDPSSKIITLAENLAALSNNGVENGMVGAGSCARWLDHHVFLPPSLNLGGLSVALPTRPNARISSACSAEPPPILPVSQLYNSYRFTFDTVYGPSSSQEEVYAQCARPAVLNVLQVGGARGMRGAALGMRRCGRGATCLTPPSPPPPLLTRASPAQGYNASIIAYGQTGTGKTFTMEGEEGSDRSGIIPRAIQDVFSSIARDTGERCRFLVRASYLQIYNEVWEVGGRAGLPWAKDGRSEMARRRCGR